MWSGSSRTLTDACVLLYHFGHGPVRLTNRLFLSVIQWQGITILARLTGEAGKRERPRGRGYIRLTLNRTYIRRRI